MNLAFSFHRNKGLCDDNPLQSYKIVSLWGMLKFYAFHFVSLCSNLARSYGYIQALESSQEQAKAISLPILPTVIAGAAGHLEFK